ncbi:MAG: hypothetical protein ACOX8H_04670 [Ruminococcus sp.]
MSRHTGKFSWKKGIVIAAAATMVLGTTVFAAGRIVSITGSSSSEPTFTEFPTAEQVNQEIGISPKLVEDFQNGFSFQGAVVVDGALQDAEGNDAANFQSMNFNYEKDGSRVNLDVKDASVEEMIEGEGMEGTGGGETLDYQDLALDYSQYTNKVVPADYELTEEDKAAEEAGDIVFSYGADDVSVSVVKTVTWEENGVSYLLQSSDDNVTRSDLVSMAQELIDLA